MNQHGFNLVIQYQIRGCYSSVDIFVPNFQRLHLSELLKKHTNKSIYCTHFEFFCSLLDSPTRLLWFLQKTNRNLLIEDCRGQTISAMTLFSLLLGCLKKTFLQQLEDSVRGVGEDCVRWVITVPAIWDDSAKQFMREAAEKVSCNVMYLYYCKYSYLHPMIFCFALLHHLTFAQVCVNI